MPQAQPGTSYYRISAHDTAGKKQEFLAAYRNQEFVVFQMDGNVAQVMYLLKAPTPADIRPVFQQHIIDVDDAKLLDERPTIDTAMLLPSHPWTEMHKGIVGVILETRDVR